MIAGGTAPDVMMLYEVTTPVLAKSGKIQDLTPYYSKDQSFDIDDFYDNSLTLARQGDKLFGLGYSMSPHVLYYNKDMFDKAGVDYPDGSWDWNDYLNAAKKLTVKKDGKIVQYGGTTGPTVAPTWYVSALIKIWQNGGSIFKDGKANFDSPQVIESLQFWADMMNREHVAPNPAESSGQGSLFSTGKAAMTTDGVWDIETFKKIKDFKWDIAPLPKGKKQANVLHSSYYAMSSQTKHPDAAWKLIKFLTNEKIQMLYDSKLNYLPTRKSVNAKKPYVPDDGIPAHSEIIGQSVQNGSLLKTVPGIKQVTDEFQKQINSIYTGKVSAKEAMTAFQSKAQQIIDSHK
jgi:multiple sugar transport system substrate-binding protein